MRFLKSTGFKQILALVLFLLPQALLAQDEGVNVVNSAKDTLIQVNDAGVSVPLGVSASRVSRSFRVHGGATREEDATYFSVSTVGNVGIGTDNPSAALHVTGGSSFFQGASSSDTLMNVGDSGINVSLGDGSNRVSRSFRVHGGATRAGDTFFSINENGNVGIGTDNPAAAFHVTGGASLFEGIAVGDTLMNVNDDGVNIALSEGRVSRSFRVHGGATRSIAPFFSVNSSGFIGIGTHDPVELLDIDGGGINIGNTTRNNAGSIRWTGADFEGFNGQAWKSFTSGSGDTTGWRQTTVSGRKILYTTDNYVGIGTSNPSNKLDVRDEWIGASASNDNYIKAEMGPIFAKNGTKSYGYMGVYGATAAGYPLAAMTAVYDTVSPGERGWMGVFNKNGFARARMFASADDAGVILLTGQNNRDNVLISYLSGFPNNGWMGVQGSGGYGDDGVRIYVNPFDAGQIDLFGRSGRCFILIGQNGGNPNLGHIGVADTTGALRARMYATADGKGYLVGTVIASQMEYPGRANEEIWYGGMVGPEAAAYVRGTGQLINGQARITLPDHFVSVSDFNTGMTVQLTPLSAESKGLAVIEKGAGGLVVRELFSGTGNYQFDWEVKCVRKDQRDFQSVRAKDELIAPESLPAAAAQSDGVRLANDAMLRRNQPQ